MTAPRIAPPILAQVIGGPEWSSIRSPIPGNTSRAMPIPSSTGSADA